MLALATAHTLASPRLSRAGAAARPGVAATRCLPLAAARCSAAQGNKAQKLKKPSPPVALPPPAQLLARSIAAAAVSGLLLFSAVPPSMAELVTVTPQEATEMARPLKKQQFNKGRIWGLFVLGATALFGCTVVLENNSKLFPAISRSNQAMRMARKQQEEREAASAAEQAAFEQRLVQVRSERERDAGAEAAVMEGLLEAREARGISATPAASLPAAAAAATALAEEATAVSEALAKGQVEAEERQEAEVEEKAEGKHDEKAEPSSSTSEPSSQRSTAGNDSVAAAEERKPLFEISAEQIEASAQQRRLDELQQELERRKKAGAGAGAGSSSAAQQE
ncbi:hypothetical protein D9Q98_001308 [Chlorella vulgaris]|uniref:Uncharacterized protein n=1 Tax=Chlorella vulgaris TaxID=3077 RepID=A0A9D4Z1Z4_CHLVU|nr:hypothetical protein D9Q98_001308 [Chlorella vulgaris]